MTRKREERDIQNMILADTGEVKAPLPSIDSEPAAETPKGPSIYLGPNLPGGRLLQSTVFRGGIPAYLQPILVEQLDVTALIVPVDEMVEAQARITKTGTPEYLAYQSLLKGVTNDVH
ncbi:hypothetical protein [Paenibacillus piscarius]|uniref:hypothetical protein n=1 Tax=Paenibacillus piscarius TaxID=1089681 RepID=UPI001EE987AE|nr:hypothetical protein [Paenibacillus piscarius]